MTDGNLLFIEHSYQPETSTKRAAIVIELCLDTPEGPYLLSETHISRKELLQWLGLSKLTFHAPSVKAVTPIASEKMAAGCVSLVAKQANQP